MACPAGTVKRNQFWNGVGQGPAQFDGAGDIAKLVENAKDGCNCPNSSLPDADIANRDLFFREMGEGF